MPSGHEIVAQFMSQKDEHNGDGITRSSRHPGGNHRQDEENNMDGMAAHGKRLFLLLVTIPVQLLFVFVFSHLLPSLFNDAPHNSSSVINSLIIITTLFYKIPPHLPFPKGGKIPLFGKEGRGEILLNMSIQF